MWLMNNAQVFNFPISVYKISRSILTESSYLPKSDLLIFLLIPKLSDPLSHLPTSSTPQKLRKQNMHSTSLEPHKSFSDSVGFPPKPLHPPFIPSKPALPSFAVAACPSSIRHHRHLSLSAAPSHVPKAHKAREQNSHAIHAALMGVEKQNDSFNQT